MMHLLCCRPLPVLIGGDFNSLPDSGVFEYLSEGKISMGHSDLEEFDYTAFTNKVGTNHQLRLSGTYEESLCTNFTLEFKGKIDYLFYSKGTVIPVRYLGAVDQVSKPPERKSYGELGLPCYHVKINWSGGCATPFPVKPLIL